jgi:hypothetical protein
MDWKKFGEGVLRTAKGLGKTIKEVSGDIASDWQKSKEIAAQRRGEREKSGWESRLTKLAESGAQISELNVLSGFRRVNNVQCTRYGNAVDYLFVGTDDRGRVYTQGLIYVPGDDKNPAPQIFLYGNRNAPQQEN